MKNLNFRKSGWLAALLAFVLLLALAAPALAGNTWYIDPVSGNNGNSGVSWALAWANIDGATAAKGVAAGDTIRIAKSPDPTSLGQTALFTNLSRAVVLQTGAVTAHVSTCDHAAEAWTNGANATCSSQTSQYKMGSNNGKAANRTLQIVIGAAASTTELLAYRDLGAGGLDFSGYQQISFWIRNSVALTAGMLKLCLCSDQAGTTIVDSFAIPAIPSTNQWVPITVNKGSALGASIKSVALYSDTVDPGTPTLQLDNIIACKAAASADSITLQSLISKNSAAQGGTEPWYCIQSINGTSIFIDNHTNQLGNGGRGYTGATETVTIYKRETFNPQTCLLMMASASSTNVQATAVTGSRGNLIYFAGGYNTATNDNDGDTWFDGLNGFGYGLNDLNVYLSFDKINFCRYQSGFYAIDVSFCNIGFMEGISCTGSPVWIRNPACNGWTMTTVVAINNNGSLNFDVLSYSTIGSIVAYGSLSDGYTPGLIGNKTISCSCKNNALGGLTIGTSRSAGGRINNFTAADNGTAAIREVRPGEMILANAIIADSTIVSQSVDSDGRYYFQKYGGVATDHRLITGGGVVSSNTAVRHTASGVSWQFSPSSTGRTSSYPLYAKIAEVAVNASAQVTVSAWLRRDNTGLTMSLVCRGGQIAGVASDVVASMTAAADTWEEVTITFTPSEAGVVEIEVWAYGGTTYSGYVDDMTFTQ